MAKHLRIWWRFYFCLSVAWMAQNFLPGALQGASSEFGQDVYGWLTSINGVLEMVKLLEWFHG